MLNEFKAFISKGNVLDLAVGIIIGAAFTAIVTSLVDDLIKPLIGMIIGGIDFSSVGLLDRRRQVSTSATSSTPSSSS
jgi:large conductance mechanosensitive channel